MPTNLVSVELYRRRRLSNPTRYDWRWRMFRSGKLIANGLQGYSNRADAIQGLEVVTNGKVQPTEGFDAAMKLTRWTLSGDLEHINVSVLR